jgi:hypothetical protein
MPNVSGLDAPTRSKFDLLLSHDHMVRALAANRANYPFDKGTLPGVNAQPKAPA